MTKSVTVALVIAFSLSLSVEVATGSRSQQATGSPNGEEVFLNRCSTCHGTERALVAPRTRQGWEGVLADMVNNGLLLEAGELEAILAFLTERHGLVNVNAAKATELAALGLSQKDADTIVSYRTDHGPFADFAALRGVPGLDVDRLDAVRERVAFRD
jgi:competence ComEA-like helix-hairpin-helix protein